VIGALTHLVSGSPWSYAVVFAVIAGDAVLPLLPGETVLITASVLAVRGDLDLPLVYLAAAAGAWCGDNAAYWIGRRGGRPAAKRLFHGDKARARLAWAQHHLRRRGPLIIVCLRPVPGARTATTFSAGALGMRWRAFVPAAAVAAVVWTAEGVGLGAVGGAAFQHSLWKPIALSLAVALILLLVLETGRRLRPARVPAHGRRVPEIGR
jgi:membrane-associated protein